MTWFWLNVPLDAFFFLAVAGIPTWLVLRRPDSDRQVNVLAGSAR